MGDLTKGVLDDRGQRVVVQVVVVDLGSEEELPLGLELFVQAISTATAAAAVGRSRSGGCGGSRVASSGSGHTLGVPVAVRETC